MRMHFIIRFQSRLVNPFDFFAVVGVAEGGCACVFGSNINNSTHSDVNDGSNSNGLMYILQTLNFICFKNEFIYFIIISRFYFIDDECIK